MAGCYKEGGRVGVLAEEGKGEAQKSKRELDPTTSASAVRRADISDRNVNAAVSSVKNCIVFEEGVLQGLRSVRLNVGCAVSNLHVFCDLQREY